MLLKNALNCKTSKKRLIEKQGCRESARCQKKATCKGDSLRFQCCLHWFTWLLLNKKEYAYKFLAVMACFALSLSASFSIPITRVGRYLSNMYYIVFDLVVYCIFNHFFELLRPHSGALMFTIMVAYMGCCPPV